MRFLPIPLFTVCFFFISFIQLRAQSVPTVLHVTGPTGQSVALTPVELRALPHVEHRAKDHDGQQYTYAGVPLTVLLRRVGAPTGGQLKGQALASYLLVEGADGYRVVFALPELDSLFTRQTIFLADQRDGKPLPAEQGPYQIVVPQDTKHARWVRQVTRLSVHPAK